MKRLLLIFMVLKFIDVTAQQNHKLVTPAYLQKGDSIAILAPAGILKNRNIVINKAKALAESWGLKVILGEHIFSKAGHFAGTDEERCKDFQNALDNPSIKAIWCARGGYGSVRILDCLDYSKFLERPKWIVGYSDITAFHNHIHNLGVETLHAMMGISMQNDIEEISETIETFRKSLFGEVLNYKIPSSNYNRAGVVEGQLVGGNIAILASMLGSESQISTDNKILFIEEIGEYKYAIDRMLCALKRAGCFAHLKGVVVGGMTDIKKNTTSWGSSIEQLILDAFPTDIPIVFDFPAGHDPDNRALYMGRNVKLKVDKEYSLLEFE